MVTYFHGQMRVQQRKPLTHHHNLGNEPTCIQEVQQVDELAAEAPPQARAQAVDVPRHDAHAGWRMLIDNARHCASWGRGTCLRASPCASWGCCAC